MKRALNAQAFVPAYKSSGPRQNQLEPNTPMARGLI